MSSLNAADLFSVKGLVVVITGGGTGIGLMMTKALEANGAKVYIIGRRKDKLDEAAKQAKHDNIIPIQGDVTNRVDLERIVQHITKEDGFINTLINNSGIVGPNVYGLPETPSVTQFRDYMLKYDPDEFTSVYHVNTSAVFFTTVAFLELLDAGNKKGNVEQKSQVITTSSIGGFSRLPLVGYAYNSSKAATTHMMKQFATAFVPWNIRANIIAPGMYVSETTEEIHKQITESGGYPQSWIPLQRAGTEEDMGGAILFMASRAGAYLNGSVTVTDGGKLSISPATY